MIARSTVPQCVQSGCARGKSSRFTVSIWGRWVLLHPFVVLIHTGVAHGYMGHPLLPIRFLLNVTWGYRRVLSTQVRYRIRVLYLAIAKFQSPSLHEQS